MFSQRPDDDAAYSYLEQIRTVHGRTRDGDQRRTYRWVLNQHDEPVLPECKTAVSRHDYREVLRGTVYTAIDRALMLLDSDKGFQSLVGIGLKAVSGWKKREVIYHDRLDVDDMFPRASTFLDQLWETFVNIRLTDKHANIGHFKMNDWNAVTNGTGRWNTWRPGKAGTLVLNRDIIDFMADICYKKHPGTLFNDHMFNLTVTIAQELVNCFIGFLSGTDTPAPPPGYPGRPWGLWWQKEVLGGSIKIYELPGHGLGALHPGTTWLIDEYRMGRQVTDKGKESILDPKLYRFPLEVFPGEKTLDELNHENRTTHEARAQMIANRPVRRNPSSSTTRTEERTPRGRSESRSSDDPPRNPAVPMRNKPRKGVPPYVPDAPPAPQIYGEDRSRGGPPRETAAPSGNTTRTTADLRDGWRTSARSRSRPARPPPVQQYEAYSGRKKRHE